MEANIGQYIGEYIKQRMANIYKLQFFITLLCLIVRGWGGEGGRSSGHIYTNIYDKTPSVA